MPSKMHKAIRWNKRDPYLTKGKDLTGHHKVEWRIVEPQVVLAKKIRFASDHSLNNKICQFPTEDLTPNQSVKSPRGVKRECPNDASLPNTSVKRLKSFHAAVSRENTHFPPNVLVPIGTQWKDNSCAYDAICTVLFNIWREDPAETTVSWNLLDNDLLNTLTTDFGSHKDHHTSSETASYSLDQICEQLRHRLAGVDREFTYGRYTSAHVTPQPGCSEFD